MAQFNWQRKDVETKVMRGLEADRPDPKTSNVHIFFATDTDKIYILNEEGAWDVFDVAPTTSSTLTVKTTNNAVTVNNVAEIRVPPSRLSTPSSGVAQINIPDDYSLTVRTQDNTTNVGSVSEMRFSNNTVTDLGSGRVSIVIPQPFNLTVRTQSSSPAYGNVNTLVVPNGTLSQPNSNEASIDIPPALTVREVDNVPSVANVNTLEFTNTTVTNLGSGVVRVDAAPAASRYVTYQSDANLTNAVVVPAWADHPDRANNAPANATFQQHFDGVSGITWLGNVAPAAWDENTTHKSHLYIAESGGGVYGYWSWTPAGDFDARCKLAHGRNADVGADVRFSIRSADDAREVACRLNVNSVSAVTRVGTTVTQIGAINLRFSYFRISRAGGTITWWVSDNGRAWVFLASTAFTISVARIGVSTQAAGLSLACDWIWAVG
jgi:hypothetical protein